MEKKQSFITGAFILAAGGIFAKFLGIFFKVPLSQIIGDEGIGIYGLAYPIYNTFLSISTSGLPTAVSKMVSERANSGNLKGAYKVFRLAFILLAVFGGISSVIMLFGARIMADAMQEPRAYYSILALSLAPFFVAALSALRGFFQGMQKMSYSSISQIIEQIVRVAAGVGTAYLLMKGTQDLGKAAAGGTLGATAGGLAGLLFLICVFLVFRKKQQSLLSAQELYSEEPNKQIYKNLAIIALPVALGGLSTTIMGVINSFTVVSSMAEAGFSREMATAAFGILEQKVQTLINVPFILGTALSTSLVPSISASYALKDKKKAVHKTSLATKLALLVAFPSAAGLNVLAEPILTLIPFQYSQSIAYDASILQWMSFVIIFTLTMTTHQGILQGAGHYYKPIINLVIGSAAKFILNTVLIRIPSLNIYGAIISTITASAIVFVLNLTAVKKSIGMNRIGGSVIKIIICTAAMGITAKLGYWGLSMFMNAKAATVIIIPVCIAVYGALILFTKAVTKEELSEARG